MKKLALAVVATAAIWSGSANAAPPAPDVAGELARALFTYQTDWGGWYGGINYGLDWNASTRGSFPNDPPYLWQAGRDPAVAGLHGGYQRQWGNLILGIEGGATWTLGESFASTESWPLAGRFPSRGISVEG